MAGSGNAFLYSVFAVRIRSDSPIAGLDPLPDSDSPPDLEIFVGVSPDEKDGVASSAARRLSYSSTFTDEGGEPVLKVWELQGGAFFHLIYQDGTHFWFDRGATRLWITWSEGSSFENAVLYLLGPILALLLRFRGVVCLHASAVLIGDRAVVFVGPEEAGKSTTAAAFARKGFSILSDDVVPLREEHGSFFVLPGSPHLRLWPESVEMLFGPAESLPQLLPGWDKKRLSPGDHDANFSRRISQLGAIYVLTERSAAPGTPRIDDVDKQSALLSLIANTYASQLIDPRMRAEEFELLGRLVSHVPIRQLSPHSDSRRIDELCDLVSADLSRHRSVIAAP